MLTPFPWLNEMIMSAGWGGWIVIPTPKKWRQEDQAFEALVSEGQPELQEILSQTTKGQKEISLSFSLLSSL